MALLRAIGLMSGTSMDGIDMACIETDGETAVRRGPSGFMPYEAAFRRRIESALETAKVIRQRDERPDGLAELEAAITLRHARAVETFLDDNGWAAQDIDLIGFHGQTVLHRPDEALTLRLMLVHIFRAIVLRDPDLPKELLPSDWYGGQARSLFAELYLRLSPPAELAIQEHFVDANGPLTADLSRLARRITDLSGV